LRLFTYDAAAKKDERTSRSIKSKTYSHKFLYKEVIEAVILFLTEYNIWKTTLVS